MFMSFIIFLKHTNLMCNIVPIHNGNNIVLVLSFAERLFYVLDFQMFKPRATIKQQYANYFYRFLKHFRATALFLNSDVYP